jgi:hypothetical protein
MLERVEYKKMERKRKCGERGSNTRPLDLQSDALPTELSPLIVAIHNRYLTIIYLHYWEEQNGLL